jgi:HEPN domain-containing protein
MTEIDVIQEWLKFALNDLLVAKNCLAMRPQQIEIACYHCQQSAEKALKGCILWLCKIEPPKVHNLVQLYQQCLAKDANFANILTSCSDLTAYGAMPRYPHELALDEAEAVSAVKNAQKVYEFCLSKIPAVH